MFNIEKPMTIMTIMINEMKQNREKAKGTKCRQKEKEKAANRPIKSRHQAATYETAVYSILMNIYDGEKKSKARKKKGGD